METKTKTRAVYWLSPAPEKCDLSGQPIKSVFVDGSIGGHWGCFLPGVFRANGGSLGLGRGQLYRKQDDGRWLKTEG